MKLINSTQKTYENQKTTLKVSKITQKKLTKTQILPSIPKNLPNNQSIRLNK